MHCSTFELRLLLEESEQEQEFCSYITFSRPEFAFLLFQADVTKQFFSPNLLFFSFRLTISNINAGSQTWHKNQKDQECKIAV